MGELVKARKKLEDARGDVRASGSAIAPAPTEAAATAAAATAAKELLDTWREKAYYRSMALVGLAGLGGVASGLGNSATQVKKAAACTAGCAHKIKFVWSDDRFALTLASATTALVLIAIGHWLSGKDEGGLVGLVVGQDNRISTSKTQVGLWTIAVVFAFFFFSFQFFRTQSNVGFDSLDSNYLLLLGGPFAAAVLASATTSAKDDDGTLQKVPAASPAVSDVAKDDDGGVSIADTQFLLFNLVALTYFVVALLRDPSRLPDIPTTLVGLTSVSALTYLGAKVASSTTPIITSVSVDSASTLVDGKMTAGSTVRILGKNFMPTSSQPELVAKVGVTFNGIAAIVRTRTDTEIAATVPDLGSRDEPVDIAVQTSAGKITAPYRTLTYKKV